MGQFPLQPLSLSPPILQHPMCPCQHPEKQESQLVPSPISGTPALQSLPSARRQGWLPCPHTFPQVGVDAHVTRCPCQALVLSVGDVFFGLGVNILFGQAKIDDVDGVLPLAARPPHQEVLWLDISVDQAFGVDILHPCDLGQKEMSVPGQRPHPVSCTLPPWALLRLPRPCSPQPGPSPEDGHIASLPRQETAPGQLHLGHTGRCLSRLIEGM